jgi:hypothetical protein
MVVLLWFMNQLIIGGPHPVAIAGINTLFIWNLRTLLGIEYIYTIIPGTKAMQRDVQPTT